MDPLDSLNHLLNFTSPALAMAVGMVVWGHLFFRKRAQARGWLVPIALHFAVGCVVLMAGLVVLGRDGKMVSYAGLVLASATAQWLLLRAWRG